MSLGLGPRSRPVYRSLREQIVAGELAPGAKLPSHTALAAEFRVAPMTLRQVLDRLEAEGLVSRETGRGTFVRAAAAPAVLIVDDEAEIRAVLARHVRRAGYSPIEAAGPSEGLAALQRDRDIALVISDVRMPDRTAGIDFIRIVRRRWRDVPLAALTGYPDDLAPLHGTPDCPILVVPKPFRTNQIEEMLRLALRPLALVAAGAGR
jgi:CheY-like chemotaxis protein